MEVKKEQVDRFSLMQRKVKGRSTFASPAQTSVIELSSSQSESGSSSDESEVDVSSSGNREHRELADVGNTTKRKRNDAVLPEGFLDPLPLTVYSPVNAQPYLVLPPAATSDALSAPISKQFWKAGDYERLSGGDWASSGGMDHVRVHPRFLHSNATSHKWVLGALAELLDNSLDEVRNGATHVTIDMITNKKDGNKMLLIEDNGGGMNPDKMRHCMSLGYSEKSHMMDTIGQYGNGFKTSTMRLGADVIVFSRCCGRNKERSTQSIGFLSYTFLTSTGKEDIVVPMLDYEKREDGWSKIVRSSTSDWDLNLDAIIQWSPFCSEKELLQQFNQMKSQGTRIIIYNLWEDDQGLLELDFDSNSRDIQTRGVSRDEKNIEMAQKYPNSRHFLTYKHSLRSYAAILYLRVPAGFRIILRGKDIEHHNIVNDMMMSQEITYRPHPGSDGIPRDSNMVAVVTVGFVKDAKSHIDVQGFNVYHKNRLIKPFWRVWNPAGSDGRGVIGVLEANFVEPAHDKQGFERTSVLARLESRLVQLQKTYWGKNCHKIGYAPRAKIAAHSGERASSPDSVKKKRQENKSNSKSDKPVELPSYVSDKGYAYGKDDARTPRKRPTQCELSSSEDEEGSTRRNQSKGLSPSKGMFGKDVYQKSSRLRNSEASKHSPITATPERVTRNSKSQMNSNESSPLNPHSKSPQAQPEEVNQKSRERLKRKEEASLTDLQRDLHNERVKCKSLSTELEVIKNKYEELQKEQDSLIDLFTQEKQRHNKEEETLRQKIKAASSTIKELRDKVKWLERKGV